MTLDMDSRLKQGVVVSKYEYGCQTYKKISSNLCFSFTLSLDKGKDFWRNFYIRPSSEFLPLIWRP